MNSTCEFYLENLGDVNIRDFMHYLDEPFDNKYFNREKLLILRDIMIVLGRGEFTIEMWKTFFEYIYEKEIFDDMDLQDMIVERYKILNSNELKKVFRQYFLRIYKISIEEF